jgi:site-specific recombinase XerC
MPETVEFRPPRQRRKAQETPKCLTEAELESLFKAIKSPRDRAIFQITYHRGLRASEPGKLDLKDYRPAEGRLYVRRVKGSISARFRLTDVENTALRAWLRVRGLVPGPLFCSRNHRAISPSRLDQLMKQSCRLAGIPEEKAHMHALKHSCGTTHPAMRGPDGAPDRDSVPWPCS